MTAITQPKSGASLNRHRSKQDYRTPKDFVEAVEKRFGKLSFDLAAKEDNSLCGACYFSKEQDSLKQAWTRLQGNLWLNPEYNDITPWAAKCALAFQSSSACFERILFLVPASVGSNWFADYVYDHAQVIFLRPRLSFDGINPYPRDLMLCNYDPNGLDDLQFLCWKWK